MYHLSYSYQGESAEDLVVDIPKNLNPGQQYTMIEQVIKYLARDTAAMDTLRQQGTLVINEPVVPQAFEGLSLFAIMMLAVAAIAAAAALA